MGPARGRGMNAERAPVTGLQRWLPLLARFAAGQAGIHVINLVTGLLILRLLSIEEYALYILASLLQTVGALTMDLGAAQALVSLGAPLREDRRAMGRLVGSALWLGRRLSLLALAAVVAVSYVLMRGAEATLAVGIAVTGLSIALARLQYSAAVATAVLNAHHDSAGLLSAGFATAALRLVLVAVACVAAPLAWVALAVNLAGALLMRGLLWRAARRHADPSGGMAPDLKRALVRFMWPLVPGIAYYLVQGQVATLLLASAGITTAVAEVGALGRLGQIVAVLGWFNGFFVQPYFARIVERGQFLRRLGQLGALLAAMVALITGSAVWAPDLWLLLLGPNYGALSDELVLALAGAQLSVLGGLAYTVVIATGRTAGQWLQIPLGLGAQAAFLASVGVAGTHDALVLNLLPAATYLALQVALLARNCLQWKADGPAA